jgi:CRP/FNR family transcriptional regulator, cyclic AMP receptor protein
MRALDGFGRPPRLGALQGLASLGRRRVFSPGQVLFSQAAGASHAALIVSGLVKTTAVSPGGHETFLAIRGPGELLGEDAAFRGTQGYSADGRQVVATALTEAIACVFPAGQLQRFLHDHPAAIFAVARSLGDRLAEAETRICSAGRDNADRRLARLLCDLERYGEPAGNGPGGGTTLPVPLSHSELAAWIGSCRETVDRALGRWRDRGIISTAYRTIVIHDRQALGRIAGIRVPSRRPLPGNPAPAGSARQRAS